MTVQMVIEFRGKSGAQPAIQAIEAYKRRLRSGIERGKRHLAQFERQYGVNTDYFLQEMATEDLDGGDLEYVEWAGEAKLLKGLKDELIELDHKHTPTGVEISSAPTLAQVVDEILKDK